MVETLSTEVSVEEKRAEINVQFNDKFQNSKEKNGLNVLEQFNRLKEKLKLNKEMQNDFEKNSLALIQKSWLELSDRFGINGEGVKESNIRFHDLSHTIEFIETQMEIFDAILAANLDYSSKSGLLLTNKNQAGALRIIAVVGGSYHDIVQGKGPGKNEDESATKLKEDIDNFFGHNFSPAGIKLMEAGINATKIKDYSNLEQITTFPEGNLEHLFEGLYGDSDLAAFLKFKSQHWRGNRLFWELRPKEKSGQSVSYEEALKWFDIQISVMEKHRDKYVLKDKLANHPPYNLMYDEEMSQAEANIQLYMKLKEVIAKKKAELGEDEELSQILARFLTVNQQQAEEIKLELGFKV